MVNIYANNLRHIKENDLVEVRTVAYPDQTHVGKIGKIYNTFDEDEHVLKAKIELDNPDLNLLPGLSAEIIINRNDTNQKGYVIDNQSIVFSNNQQFVIVYHDDCHLEVRSISPKTQNEKHTYVVEGFRQGELLIHKNALLVFEQIN